VEIVGAQADTSSPNKSQSWINRFIIYTRSASSFLARPDGRARKLLAELLIKLKTHPSRADRYLSSLQVVRAPRPPPT
jgi:hypothetical protein